MIGSILKYATVAVIGGVGFAFASQYMDAEVLDGVKAQLAIQEKAYSDLTPDELKEKMQAFIKTNRTHWTEALTFASNLKELNAVLDAWF